MCVFLRHTRAGLIRSGGKTTEIKGELAKSGVHESRRGMSCQGTARLSQGWLRGAGLRMEQSSIAVRIDNSIHLDARKFSLFLVVHVPSNRGVRCYEK